MLGRLKGIPGSGACRWVILKIRDPLEDLPGFAGCAVWTCHVQQVSDYRNNTAGRRVTGGLSNSDIAKAATIGESTVKTHLSSILAKLGLTSRAQIVAHAYESGLLSSWPTNTTPDFLSGGKRP
jgi:DNA-binding CsgD family transcriptional regulator